MPGASAANGAALGWHFLPDWGPGPQSWPVHLNMNQPRSGLVQQQQAFGRRCHARLWVVGASAAAQHLPAFLK